MSALTLSLGPKRARFLRFSAARSVSGSQASLDFVGTSSLEVLCLGFYRSRGDASTEGDAMQAATDIKFKVGDKAVYPAQGVAEVIRIEENNIADTRQRLYVLRILYTDRKILVHVANADACGLRQGISDQEIREIFDIWGGRPL